MNINVFQTYKYVADIYLFIFILFFCHEVNENVKIWITDLKLAYKSLTVIPMSITVAVWD